MDMDAALKDGYSLAEVNAEAARRTGFKYTDALNDGYTDDDISQELRKRLKAAKPQQADDYGLTGIKSAFAGVGNTVDNFLSQQAGSLVAPFSTDTADKIFKGMDEREASRNQWANPEGKELGIGSKVLGAVATLPMQIPSSIMSPASSGKTAIQAGESLPTAMGAAGLDTLGNAAGFLLGQGKTLFNTIAKNAGANAAQDYVTKWVQQQLMSTEAGQQAFNPTVADALVSAIVGGGTAGAMHKPTNVPKGKLGTIKEQQAAVEASKPLPEAVDPNIEFYKQEALRKQQEAPAKPITVDEQGIARTAEQENQQRQTPSDYTPNEGLNGQRSLFDYSEEGRMPNPYEAVPGDWRVDENGMPIKVDLSMDAANAENPLQRNLWGDELPQKHPQENELNIPQAIDSLPDLPWKDQREEALSRLQGELPATGELQGAIEAARRSADSVPEVMPPLGSKARQALMKKQGGGLLMDWSSSKKEQASLENASDLADEALIPKNPVAADVVRQALTEGKDGKFLTYLQSGATSTAMKTGSAAIKAASEIVQNAGKRAELAIRNVVSPAETALRKLSSKEITELHDVFKDEMFSNRRFDADVLASNLSVKQLEAYTHMREMFDKALDAQNAERVAKGMKPITANEAYMSSRWKGDFRRGIQDKDGKTVWYLASNSKFGLERQTKALLAKFPDLKYDVKKDHHVSSGQSKTDLQSMYSTMLDILDRDDPAIQRIQQAIEEQTIAEGESTLGQEKHFKAKGNVRGFVGDRPGYEGKSEAIAMFHEQLQYAKNALTWSEMQTAANDIKGIISDPDLKAQQPHNVNYIREYFKNAIGHGEAKAIRVLSDNIRDGLGVSPKVFDEAIGDVKSFFILQKLAASAGFTLANVVQTTNVLPYLMDLRGQGFKGNPVTAMAVGVPTGMMMMASHYLKSVGGEYIDKLPNQFLKDAIRYAEANGVTSRSVYDESPLETGFSPIKNAVNIASKTMTIPETFVRSVAFMTYAQMLKDSGKYADQGKLFQHAEELVNASMVDYRNTEKPLAFVKGGTMGNFLNTLQTYPMSFYNQYGYMARRALDGNRVPLMTMLALQAAMGGVMASPGLDDIYKLFTWYKNNHASDATWKKMQDSPFLSDPKLWMMETLGNGSVYGYVSDKTGLGLSSRISAPSLGGMLQSPIGPAVDIAGQIGAVGSAALDPTNTTKLAQAAMKVAPVGLSGLLESADFMKDHTYTTRPDGTRVYVKANDLAARMATITRSPEEDAVRKWGLRSQREVVEKDVQYITGQQNKAVRERIGGAGGSAGELMEKFYDATRRGDKESAKRLATLYTQLSGKAINEEMIKRQIIQERLTSLERTKKSSDKLSPQELINNARMIAILKDNK